MDGLARMDLDDVSFYGNNATSIVIGLALVVAHISACISNWDEVQQYITTNSGAFYASRGAGMDGLVRLDVSL